MEFCFNRQNDVLYAGLVVDGFEYIWHRKFFFSSWIIHQLLLFDLDLASIRWFLFIIFFFNLSMLDYFIACNWICLVHFHFVPGLCWILSFHSNYFTWIGLSPLEATCLIWKSDITQLVSRKSDKTIESGNISYI